MLCIASATHWVLVMACAGRTILHKPLAPRRLDPTTQRGWGRQGHGSMHRPGRWSCDALYHPRWGSCSQGSDSVVSNQGDLGRHRYGVGAPSFCAQHTL
jgi:hypothetical protein